MIDGAPPLPSGSCDLTDAQLDALHDWGDHPRRIVDNYGRTLDTDLVTRVVAELRRTRERLRGLPDGMTGQDACEVVARLNSEATEAVGKLDAAEIKAMRAERECERLRERLRVVKQERDEARTRADKLAAMYTKCELALHDAMPRDATYGTFLDGVKLVVQYVNGLRARAAETNGARAASAVVLSDEERDALEACRALVIERKHGTCMSATEHRMGVALAVLNRLLAAPSPADTSPPTEAGVRLVEQALGAVPTPSGRNLTPDGLYVIDPSKPVGFTAPAAAVVPESMPTWAALADARGGSFDLPSLARALHGFRGQYRHENDHGDQEIHRLDGAGGESLAVTYHADDGAEELALVLTCSALLRDLVLGAMPTDKASDLRSRLGVPAPTAPVAPRAVTVEQVERCGSTLTNRWLYTGHSREWWSDVVAVVLADLGIAVFDKEQP